MPSTVAGPGDLGGEAHVRRQNHLHVQLYRRTIGQPFSGCCEVGRTRAHRACQALPHAGVGSAEPAPQHACTAIVFCQLGRCTPLRGTRQGGSQQRISPPVGLARWQCTCHSGCQMRCCSARCQSTRPLPCSRSEARDHCNVQETETNMMQQCIEKQHFMLEAMCSQGCSPWYEMIVNCAQYHELRPHSHCKYRYPPADCPDRRIIPQVSLKQPAEVRFASQDNSSRDIAAVCHALMRPSGQAARCASWTSKCMNDKFAGE